MMSQASYACASGPNLRMPAHLPFPFGSLGRAASKALAQWGNGSIYKIRGQQQCCRRGKAPQITEIFRCLKAENFVNM